MAQADSPILCPYCAQGYAWRFDAGNKRVTCKCGAIFRVPLNSFSACQLIARPGESLPSTTATGVRTSVPLDQQHSKNPDPLSTPANEMAIQEDPVEPPGYMKEITLAPDFDEPLFTENESAGPPPPNPAAPQTPPPPKKRPQIIPFDEAPPAIYQDRPPAPETPAPPNPKPTPRPRAALTDKPPVKNNEEAAREALAKPDIVALVCPHCQGELPGNKPADLCPHCKSVITPVRQNEVDADIQKSLDDPLMTVLRKRGMEQVVQTVAREAAERQALNKKHERERNVYDVWIPAVAIALSLLVILIVNLLGLRYHSLPYMLVHEFVWVVVIALPACIASMWVGQNILDAEFHLDRVLLVKVSSVALTPYAAGLLFVPGVFDMKNNIAYLGLLILVIGVYTLMIGLVYRLSLSQAAIMTGVYAMLMVLFTSTAANQLIKLILWILGLR
jgi:hypothetical protein